ncbi:MAG: 50S ribosomal protein L24 [Candidatus Micrarchaeota archaeon]|nr:50S ribosomal protein L24 [Candidatus Micrarchaeota archaeon]
MFMVSKQPRKQRKLRFLAPLHIRKKLVSAHLSDELKAKLGTKRRSIPVRKGDKVKLMRGEKKGHIGKVTKVNLSTLKIFVEGVTIRNSKGIEKQIPIDPSNVMILEGDFSKDRLKMIQRAGKQS